VIRWVAPRRHGGSTDDELERYAGLGSRLTMTNSAGRMGLRSAQRFRGSTWRRCWAAEELGSDERRQTAR
jgi:hypothetical protein